MTLADDPQDRVNVLIYDHDLTQSMLDLFEHYAVLGYKEPLVFCKYSLQTNPDFVQTSSSSKQPPDASASSSRRILEATQPKLIKPVLPSELIASDAFERTLVFLTTKGKGQAVDREAAAELLVNMHRIERRSSPGSSPSTSPESKFTEFAHDVTDGHEEDLVAYTFPLKNDSEVVAVGMVSSEDPTRVQRLELSSSGKKSYVRDSTFSAAPTTPRSATALPATTSQAPQPSESDRAENPAIQSATKR